MGRMLSRVLTGVVAAGACVISLPAWAQGNYPSNPVRMVVAFPPGGGSTDLVARFMAQRLGAQMGVQVFVENRPGASGNIGAAFVAKSAPDGHTVLLNTSGVVLSVAFGEKLPYDLVKDFAPVALVASVPLVLMVHPSVPADNVAEFIAYAKANQGKLIYGSGGAGNITHLGNLLFQHLNGIQATHVPYKGSAPALIDAMAGRFQFITTTLVSAAPPVKDKRLKGLAITSVKRSPLLPDVPTLGESVMPGFEAGSWYGLLVPAKTSDGVVRRLNREAAKALENADLRSRMAEAGIEPLGSTPKGYGDYIKSEIDRWSKLIRSAGIQLE